MPRVRSAYLLEKLRGLPKTDQDEVLERVTDGDYTTPTCPRCDMKMVMRHGPTGDFWGCPNFRLRWPRRCKQTFRLRDHEAS
jgi:restriction system protein